MLEVTEVEKDLGVYVDNGLNFEHHISECVKKANKIASKTNPNGLLYG